MRFSTVPVFAGLLALTSTAFAENSLTLADLGQDQALTAAFDQMAQGQEIPEWVRGGAVTSPAGHAAFDGKNYVVLTGCKQNECAANQIALLYQPEAGEMFGLLVTGEQTVQQQLTWLNIGGDAESIDGRTILFAATTGSLDNHPDAFDYRDAETSKPAIKADVPEAKPEAVTTTKPTPKPAEK